MPAKASALILETGVIALFALVLARALGAEVVATQASMARASVC